MNSPTAIFKAEDDEQHLVYGEVYAPNRQDSQGEFMRADTIQKMAHDFVRAGRMSQIDVMHDNQVVPGCCVVESFIASKEDTTFIPGSWVVAVHVPDEKLWQSIKRGDINGFSLEAFVTKHPQTVEMHLAPVESGLTSKSEGHEHKFYVTYDAQGNFMGGVTDYVMGHKHDIIAGTHTERTNGHSHRFSSVDGMEIQ